MEHNSERDRYRLMNKTTHHILSVLSVALLLVSVGARASQECESIIESALVSFTTADKQVPVEMRTQDGDWDGSSDWDSSILIQIVDPGQTGLEVGQEVILYNPNRQLGYRGLSRRTFENVPLRIEENVREDDIARLLAKKFKSMTYKEKPVLTFVGSEKYESIEDREARLEKDSEQVRLSAISTFEEFEKLNDSDKLQLINQSVKLNKELILFDDDVSKLTAPADRNFAIKAIKKLKEETRFEADDEMVSSYGEPTFKIILLKDSKGKILGGEITGWLHGVSDENGPRHFESLEDALKEGGEEGDVIWRARLTFDSHFNHIGNDGNLEWMGY